MVARSRLALFALASVAISACVSSEPWPSISLPASGKSGASARIVSQPRATRVATLIDGPADAYMMVVAYQRAAEVGRWSGPIDWFRETPVEFTIERVGRYWAWSRQDARSLRVRAPNRKKGGALIHEWAADLKANRVQVVVVDNPGEPDDGAGTEGFGVQGQGRGDDRPTPAQAAQARGPDTQGDDTVDVGQGEPATGQGQEPSMSGYGLGQGDGRGDGVGRGTRDTGSRDGSDNGSDEPSWYHNPRSDIAEYGGRTPADHGKKHGSASGKAGETGHVNGAGWLNWIDVPVKLSGAAAIVAIALSADISGLADKLFQKAVRGIVRAKLRSRIVAEAKGQAKAHLSDARRALRAKADTMSAEQMAQAVKNLPESLELAFYSQLQTHARKQASLYRAILAQPVDGVNDVAKHARKLATENLAAWRQIEEVAGQQGRAIKAAARPPDAVAKQPYDAHKQRAALEAGNLGKVDSTTVPRQNHPNVKNRGTHAHGSTIPIDRRGFPIFDHVALHDIRVPRSSWVGRSRRAPQRAATRELRQAIADGKVSAKQFNTKQLEAIKKGYAHIPDYTWHHHQDVGRMQLIPMKYHEMSLHVGGYEMWQKSK